MSIDRRTLLLSTGAWPWLNACQLKIGETLPPSRIVGAEAHAGHRLRGALPAASQSRKTRVLIVGSGASGAAAAYTLQKSGFTDFSLIDLAQTFGGNARSGGPSDARYPWGAHYLPQADEENRDLIDFLEHAGAMKNGVYNEDYLCHDREERIYYQGSWHEGLIPWASLKLQDRSEVEAFLKLVESIRGKRDAKNKHAFRIPLDESSRENEYIQLDQQTFADFIRGQGWHSPFLSWYLNYCCRDDYGTDWEETSAWAGLHYFAARSGDKDKVLTWPEGNHWLVKQLLVGSEDRFHGDELSCRLLSKGKGWSLETYKSATGLVTAWEADAVILAVPRFVAARLGVDLPFAKQQVSYAPWMVANCHARSLPTNAGPGPGLAWDNVPYGSASLGYVVANHQTIARYPGASTLTSYWPLTGGSSEYLRTMAGFRASGDWARLVLADFDLMHPGFRSEIEGIDIWLWGHGMIQPKPGYLWGQLRDAMNQPTAYPGLYLAHTDMSGISIFEEAFAQGVKAARGVLRQLG